MISTSKKEYRLSIFLINKASVLFYVKKVLSLRSNELIKFYFYDQKIITIDDSLFPPVLYVMF